MFPYSTALMRQSMCTTQEREALLPLLEFFTQIASVLRRNDISAWHTLLSKVDADAEPLLYNGLWEFDSLRKDVSSYDQAHTFETLNPYQTTETGVRLLRQMIIFRGLHLLLISPSALFMNCMLWALIQGETEEDGVERT